MKKLFVVITCITSICLMNLLCGCGKSDKYLNQEAERIFKELAQQRDTTLIDALTIIDNYESQMANEDLKSREGMERFRIYRNAQKYVNNKILAIAPEYIDNTDKGNPRVEPKIYIRVMRLCGLSTYQFKDDKEVTFDGAGWKLLFIILGIVIAICFGNRHKGNMDNKQNVPSEKVLHDSFQIGIKTLVCFLVSIVIISIACLFVGMCTIEILTMIYDCPGQGSRFKYIWSFAIGAIFPLSFIWSLVILKGEQIVSPSLRKRSRFFDCIALSAEKIKIIWNDCINC